MTDFDFDLRYIQTCLGVLKQYLIIDELYYSLGLTLPMAAPPYPRLTPGNLLLYMTRLRSRHESKSLNNRQMEGLRSAEIEFAGLLVEWRAHWEKKIYLETSARMRQWQNYIIDMMDQGGDSEAHFKHEVRIRTILELLIDNMAGTVPEEVKGLVSLDERLKSYLVPSGFIWKTEVSKGFPKEKYWYLWGKLR